MLAHSIGGVVDAVGVDLGADAATPADSPTRAEDIEFFENEIRPLLAHNCFECHGENEKPSGGVRLDSRAAILRGGESGPVVTPGKPDESLLIEAIRYRSVEMPPKGKLPDDQIAKLTRWVEMGLPWPDGDEKAEPAPRGKAFEITAPSGQFWSFQPVVVRRAAGGKRRGLAAGRHRPVYSGPARSQSAARRIRRPTSERCCAA